MAYQNILVETKSQVGIIRLNRLQALFRIGALLDFLSEITTQDSC